MIKYSIKRILLALLTTFIILSLTFILVKALPFQKPIGTVAEQFSYFEQQYRLGYLTREYFKLDGREAVGTIKLSNTTYYYYQKPIMEQYFHWLGNIVTRWDWGTSTQIKANFDAMYIIGERLPVSLSLNVISVLISVPLGILLGILAGLKKNTWIDHTISTLVMVFISIPSFVIISFLIYFLAYKSGLLPTKWPSVLDSADKKALAYIIPVTALSFGSICGYCRFVRAELCEVMSSEYLLLARTKGLTRNQAIVRHALRNAMVPILPSILAEFIGLLGGSMILEQLYGIPGIGSLYITALNLKDYNVLMVDMAVFTTIGLLANIILDLSYGFIDPRIRMGMKNQ